MPAGNEAPLHGLQYLLLCKERRLVTGVEGLLVLKNVWMMAREQNWTGKKLKILLTSQCKRSKDVNFLQLTIHVHYAEDAHVLA